MPLTLPTSWAAAFAGDCEPIWLVSIEIGVRTYLTVEDYTLGTTDTAAVRHTPSGGSFTDYALVEGSDFDAEISNEQTASNIAAAFRGVLPAGVHCYADEDQVVIVAPAADQLNSSTTDANAWSETPADAPTGVVSMVSGNEDRFGYPPVVAHVGGLGVEIDPKSRKLPRPALPKITLSDNGTGDYFRLLTTLYPDLLGKRVTVRIGAAGLAEADFVGWSQYRIRDVYVAEAYSPQIMLELEDGGVWLNDAKIRPDVINRHPLEALQSVLEQAGWRDGVDFDATSLDPSGFSDIGHWVTTVSPFADPGGGPLPDHLRPLEEPRAAIDFVNELLQVLDGTFLPDESGLYSFSRRALPASTADYALDSDSIRNLRQLPRDRGVDEVIVKGTIPFNELVDSVIFQLANENARHANAEPGSTPQSKVLEVQSAFFDGIGGLLERTRLNRLDGPGTTISLLNAPRAGFSGTRDATAPTPGTLPGSWSQDANTDATTSRLVYLLFMRITAFPNAPVITQSRREIISFDQVSNVAGGDTESGSWLVSQFRIRARALFGTVAQDWFPLSGLGGGGGDSRYVIVDVTPAVDMAQRKLARMSRGTPIVEFETDLSWYRMQLGELVALETERFVDLGRDGLTNSGSGSRTGLFELVRKEVRLGATDGSIAWRAYWAGYPTAQVYTTVPVNPSFPVRYPQFSNNYSLRLSGVVGNYCTGDTMDALDGATYAAWVGWVYSEGTEARFIYGQGSQCTIEVGASGSISGRYEVEVTIGAHTATTNDGPFQLNGWYHVAVTFEGSASVRIYVNGVSRSTTTSGSLGATLGTASGTLYLGADDSGTNPWHGLLDEIAVFLGTAAFDQDDVDRWFLRGAGVPNLFREPTVPVHWWRFENDYRDQTGLLHLTPIGSSPSFSGDVPADLWSTTRSASFDGSNDFVTYNHSDDLDGSAAAAVSAWVYAISGSGLALGDDGGGLHWRLEVNGSEVRFEIEDGSTHYEESTLSPLSASTWHHLCAVYDAGTVTLYVDGAAVASGSSGSMPATIPTISGNLQINDGGLEGYISNPAYWSATAPTAAQVVEIYSAGYPTNLENLPTLGDPTWWAPLDGRWNPRVGSGAPTLNGGASLGFVASVP